MAIHTKYMYGNLLKSNITEIFVNAIIKVMQSTAKVEIKSCLEDLLSINGILLVRIK